MRGEANHVLSGCFWGKERRRYGARKGKRRTTTGRIHSVTAIASPCSLAREWSWLLRGGRRRWKVRAGAVLGEENKSPCQRGEGGVDWELEKSEQQKLGKKRAERAKEPKRNRVNSGGG